jgi:hypothetical protein
MIENLGPSDAVLCVQQGEDKNVYAKTGCQESDTGEITVMELTCPAK